MQVKRRLMVVFQQHKQKGFSPRKLQQRSSKKRMRLKHHKQMLQQQLVVRLKLRHQTLLHTSLHTKQALQQMMQQQSRKITYYQGSRFINNNNMKLLPIQRLEEAGVHSRIRMMV